MFLRFAVISGSGWIIDVSLTVMLVYMGATPFLASLAGSVVAVTFVYVVSLRAVFEIDGRLGTRAFPMYLMWQVFSISASSALVALLAHLIAPSIAATLDHFDMAGGRDPLSAASGLSKGLVTPITLAANFLFFRWLASWAARLSPSAHR